MESVPQGQAVRVVRVLEAFVSRKTWGVRELAAELDISKSSLHRTLQELADVNQLRVLDDGRYTAGSGLLRLAFSLMRSFDISGTAWQHLLELHEQTGETAILMVYDPRQGKCAAVNAVEAERPVRYVWESLQQWSDLYLGASGKGILAFLGAEEQARVLDGLPDPLPGPRSWRISRLKRDLTETRKRGWAQSDGERFRNARGVAAPIRNDRGVIQGAVVIGWPDGPGESKRVKTLGELCKQAADGISADLGWDGTGI